MNKRIFVCGDIINQFQSEQFIDDFLISIIKSSDYSIGNLEGVLPTNLLTQGQMIQTSSTINVLAEAGFNILLLANNHIADYGKDALMNTISTIKSLGIQCIGAGDNYDDIYRPIILDNELAILNVCEAHPHYYHDRAQTYGFAWIGDNNLIKRIDELKEKYSRVIIFVHAGLEHYECPLKYYRSLYRSFVDHGADAVIASHPHIAQGLEYYNSKLICYSLGNFFFQRNEKADYNSDKENSSYSLLIDINDDSITYEIVYHRIENGKVCFVSDDETGIKIDVLNSMLGDKYETLHTRMINKVYDNLVKRLYSGCLNSIDANDSLSVKLKTIIKYLFLKQKLTNNIDYNNRTLVHLINNETYRAIVNAKFEKEYAREYK